MCPRDRKTVPRSSARRGRAIPWILALATASLLGAGCSRSSPPGVVVATSRPEVAVKELTGAHARLVWIQDQEDQKDWRGKKNLFKLLALDTEDGRGERALLSAPGHYTRPLITPKGDRVVFTDQAGPSVHVVNWDGTGSRDLGPGYGVAVWRDPRKAVEWVYVQKGTNVTDKSFDANPIRRFQLDHPTVEELVWDKTPVSTRWHGNFQVSADGTKAGGLFPWPESGIAELPNKSVKNEGNGCWTSFTSDGTDRFWKFDGAHRHLRLISPNAGASPKINVSLEGFEVYHPRWANLDRFMVQSGPYQAADPAAKGGERIGGGDPGVEIYLGRFDPDFAQIEQWVRVTRNDRADFFPDVWVDPGSPFASRRAAGAMLASVGNSNAPAGSTRSPAIPSPTWPSTRAGLVWLWEDGSRKNQVSDPMTHVERECKIEPSGLARFGRESIMDLRGGGRFVAAGAEQALSAACRAANQITLEALITPDPLRASASAALISFGAGPEQNHFVLGQKGPDYFFNVSTLHEGEPRRYSVDFAAPPGAARGAAHHLLVTLGGAQVQVFVDGELIEEPPPVKGNFSGWAPHPVVFGGPWRGQEWSGQLECVAIYNRVLSAEEVKQNAAAARARSARRKPPAVLVVQARLRAIAATPSAPAIAPYRRCLVVGDYEIQKVLRGRCDAKVIQVAHWGLMDGEPLTHRVRQPGATGELVLESFDENPQLESERIAGENTNFDAPLYYDPIP
jgi:hypothetical protein